MTKKQKLSLSILVVFLLIGLGIYKFLDSIPRYRVVDMNFSNMGTVHLYFDEDASLDDLNWIFDSIEDVPFTEDEEEEALDTVYLRESGPPRAIYNSVLEKYYILEPGGHELMSIVDESVIEEKGSYENTTIDKKSNEEYSISCVNGALEPLDGSRGWKYVKCSSETYYKKEDFKSESGYVKTCYIPVADGLYLEFDTPVKPIGSEIDDCDYLYSQGLRKATLSR